MPTYNLGRYVAEAIESVLGQTYENFEFLIIDDSSTDNSQEIIRRYAAQDSRITVKVNANNLGMVQNWNECLRLARGEYVKFLFGDDVFNSPDTLEKMVAAMSTSESIALVASARTVIDEASRPRSRKEGYRHTGPQPGTAIIQDCLLEQRNKIGEPTVALIRRSLAARGFDIRYKQMVDLEMWFHLLEQGDLFFIDEPLCSFREHAEQQTRKNLDQGLEIDEAALLIRDYAGKPYMRMSRFARAYMHYVPAYSVWKLYKKHRKITRQESLARIQRAYGYSPVDFFLFYPAFKCYKLFREAMRKVQ
jgi:glycosyltransferase involved in cell wall biosynthesis